MSERTDLKQILEKIEEVEAMKLNPNPSTSYLQTRAIHLDNLRRKYRRRASLTPYAGAFYLDLNLYKPETLLSQAFHILGAHHWLHYEADNGMSWAYWMRICTICARCEWTIFEWKKGPYKLAPDDFGKIELGPLKEFLQGGTSQ